MKNLLLITGIFFVLLITINAQTLAFYQSIDDKGKPDKQSSTFTFDKNANIYFYYSSDKEINKDEVYFEIYKIGLDGKENYEKTIYNDVDKNSKSFYVKVNMLPVGNYNIYLYTGDGIFLTSSSLTIKK